MAFILVTFHLIIFKPSKTISAAFPNDLITDVISLPQTNGVV